MDGLNSGILTRLCHSEMNQVVFFQPTFFIFQFCSYFSYREEVFVPYCARLMTQATLESPVALWIVKIRGNAEAGSRGIEWSLRAFASMRAVHLFLRARAVINFLMRAASTA